MLFGEDASNKNRGDEDGGRSEEHLVEEVWIVSKSSSALEEYLYPTKAQNTSFEGLTSVKAN